LRCLQLVEDWNIIAKKSKGVIVLRIVMLSCNTGEGHNSTARAVRDVLLARGVECDIVDVLACFSPRLSKFICNGHARLYKYTPKLWAAGYHAMENREQNAEDNGMLFDLLCMGNQKLWRILTAGHYDAVVCTHVFSGMMMTGLRRKKGIRIPCYFVATDYTCYPFTETCDLDGYFIPAKALIGEFMGAGIPGERLIPSGIPVRQAFYSPTEKPTAREALGLPLNGRVVLLVGGSMGCGPMRKVAKDLIGRLPQDAVLVSICGNNEKLYEALSEIGDPRLVVVGFTDKMALYMDAADIIVTKPGGLSTTEAANKHLPMVLFNTIGGCESPNFSFFLNRGFAVGSTETDKVVSQAAELAGDPLRLENMTRLLSESFTVNSAEMIAGTVMEAAQSYAERIEMGIFGNPSGTEGGFAMENTVTQTTMNLARSFAGESQARTRYTIYAKVAREEGWEWIARIFEETAANEAVHAEEFLEMLCRLGGNADNLDLSAGYPFQLGTTLENLGYAAEGELQEHDEAYPAFAELARREGQDDAARLWLQIARIEGVHHNTFLSLREQMQEGTLTEKSKPILWRCLNCGYTYEGKRACDPCPVCEKPQGWQEGQLDRKKMIPKK